MMKSVTREAGAPVPSRQRLYLDHGALLAPEDPSTENLGAGARVYGLPDAEVERHLHASLLVVVRLRNLDRDGDPLGMRLDLAEVRHAVGTPKKADELIG
jgi:hypothetical protein